MALKPNGMQNEEQVGKNRTSYNNREKFIRE